ncbi:hypothetical protein N7522_003020 [Penicillium canescens]|nr:hypothetical protein N7522_003020 [Penicillium canescens]
MAPDTQPKICLDVASVPNHVFRIEARGLSLKRPHSEIQVTAQLAGPAVKGGIAVALQQLRHNHPFEKGLDAVIQNCETLYALDDVFSAVSCRSLNIRTNVTVVDLLPYVSEGMARIDDATLEESFRASKHIMLDKEPSVLLCAGRIWLPNAGKFYKLKGDACRLESIGVGQKFGNTPKYPVEAKIHREGEGVSPTQSPQPQSPDESSTRRNNAKYLPDYQELYSDKLLSIHKCVKSLVLEPISGTKSTTALYKPLLSSGLSEICNDAILILRQMFCLQHKGWPYFVARKNKAALKKAASDTVRFANNLLKATEPGKHTQFAEIIQEGASFLIESVTSGSGKRLEYELDFNKAWDVFLKMATNIETLLMDLLLEEEKALYALAQEESLSTVPVQTPY